MFKNVKMSKIKKYGEKNDDRESTKRKRRMWRVEKWCKRTKKKIMRGRARGKKKGTGQEDEKNVKRRKIGRKRKMRDKREKRRGG